MELTMHGCITTLFNEIKGKYKTVGSSIELNPSRDFWKNTNSCAAGRNKEQTKTPTRKELGYELRQDEYGRDLICLSEEGAETCYQKENK